MKYYLISIAYYFYNSKENKETVAIKGSIVDYLIEVEKIQQERAIGYSNYCLLNTIEITKTEHDKFKEQYG